jgi:hypothetical protein
MLHVCRLLCEVHEEYATNIALSLRGFWVRSSLHRSLSAPCTACMGVICQGVKSAEW